MRGARTRAGRVETRLDTSGQVNENKRRHECPDHKHRPMGHLSGDKACPVLLRVARRHKCPRHGMGEI
jgi:hypothetical protein